MSHTPNRTLGVSQSTSPPVTHLDIRARARDPCESSSSDLGPSPLWTVNSTTTLGVRVLDLGPRELSSIADHPRSQELIIIITITIIIKQFRVIDGFLPAWPVAGLLQTTLE